MSQVIPEGWVFTNLGKIIELKYGKSLPAKTRDGVGAPVYGSNGIVGRHSTPLVNTPGIVVGRKGSFGEVTLASGPFSPIDTTYFVDEFYDQPLMYWFYQLKDLPLTSLNRSTAIPGLNREDAYEQAIKLPPLAEQKVIADKLDELLAQVESTKARLDAIPAILKSFRQSVLAAAVSGELVTEKPKYLKYYLSDISEKITDGEHITPKTLSHGIPLLSAKDVQENELLFENVKYVSRAVADKAISRCNPEFGDILIVSRGATVGRTHLVKIDDEFCLMGSVLLIKLNKNIVMSEYMELVFKDSRGQKQLIATSGSSAQQAIYIRDVKSFKLELPSKSIQKEIVRRVEELFGFADKVEAQVNAAQARVNNLTQAILAKAFRGELTADWRAANPELISGENSAEALLEKIKFERQFMLGKKTRKKA